MELTVNKKAIAVLNELGIFAKEENGTIYVCIENFDLELSDFEINYQTSNYEEYFS